MKPKRITIIVLLTFSLLFAQFSPASAVPPLPSSFYGPVSLNDAAVNVGDRISAWINGVKYAESLVVLYEDEKVYSLDVPGDDPETAGVIEVGIPGDSVTFRVNDFIAAESAPWQSGTNLERPLTVTTRTLELIAGWNLITLPMTPSQTFNAETLLQAINTQGGNCTQIAQWQSSSWNTYNLGVSVGQFAITLGRGYFVRCSQVGTWTFEGAPLASGVTLNLISGWNLVGIPYPASGLMASTILNDINTQGGNCTALTRWFSSAWNSYNPALPFTDFSILPDEGYFVQCTAPSSYTPGP